MSQPLRVVVLLNASAGSIDSQDDQKLRDTLASSFEKHQIAATLESIPGAELGLAAERALQKATSGELDAIIVGGGDGSIRTVAGVLAGTDVPLGILPLGTMNHFAKDLGIPLLMDEAIATVATGEARRFDLGEVNGEVFINNSSIGIYPYLVLDRERRTRRKWLPKRLAMILAGLQAVRYFPLRRLWIRAEGSVHPCRSPCVFVGNNEYLVTGTSLGTRERVDRGELGVYVARQQSRAALLWLAFRCIVGLLDQSRDLRVLKLASLELISRKRRLLVACDGEVKIIRSPLHYRSRPAALRVFVPSPN